ncbi:MAG: GGDEF domain-containing protein, partial [Lachnospiraceae bacterium]|nr:GGDEF domain-containing protein [Lachnospiraceae bacterium]
YRSYLTDILVYANTHIDSEDMKKCIETGVESAVYKDTLLFMDGIMNDFSIHYLYAIKPLKLDKTGNVMCVFSAEDHHNRYEDTEGNLYLGWVSDDEYDTETTAQLFNVMEQDQIQFFVEKTDWGTDYTGAMPLKDADGRAYAVLGVDVDITTLTSELTRHVVVNTAVIILLGFLYTVMFLAWTKNNITHPVILLEKGVVDYARRSHGQRDVDALKFEAPAINTDNEVESLSKAIVRMTEDMQDYVSDIISAEKKTKDMMEFADVMSELAVKDSMTGVRNKTAFVSEYEVLETEIAYGDTPRFGFVMIDMNFLKTINDTYGHEKGDAALKRLADTICTVFDPDHVYRVGGDEFAVILKGRDLENVEELKDRLISCINENAGGDEPWERTSAAVGVAVYDPATDHSADAVFRRADAEMYEMKKRMKTEAAGR